MPQQRSNRRESFIRLWIKSWVKLVSFWNQIDIESDVWDAWDACYGSANLFNDVNLTKSDSKTSLFLFLLFFDYLQRSGLIFCKQSAVWQGQSTESFIHTNLNFGPFWKKVKDGQGLHKGNFQMPSPSSPFSWLFVPPGKKNIWLSLGGKIHYFPHASASSSSSSSSSAFLFAFFGFSFTEKTHYIFDI